MNIKKAIITGLVINILSFFVATPSYKLFSFIFQLEPKNIWRWRPDIPLSSMPMSWWLLLIIGNTILAFLVVLAYVVFYKGIPGQGVKKGLIFGMVLWPISVLVPMFSMYVMLNIAQGAIIYFSLQGLFEYLIYGTVISLIYKEEG